MCGINGIWGPVPERRQRIEAMNERLAHRGPDADGVWEGEGIGLGHRRLAIIDLSEAANQPMHTPCGRYTLVYNGEIYNFQSLRASLAEAVDGRGWTWRGHSDTEVLLYGLALHGADFLKRCNGMFALALWDAEAHRLLLARDRMGIKPLYYLRTPQALAFSSEMRSLLRSGLSDRQLDSHALADYLRYQTVHGERTILAGIKQLPPGTSLTLDDNEELIRTWWHPISHFKPLRSNATYQETTAEVRDLLQDAVRQRLVADVPFGAFLSGGIDSSAVVALAAGAAREPLRTFTVAFEEQAHSEGPYARQVAEMYGTQHTEVQLSPKALLEELPAALDAMDHPSGDGINTYVVSQAAKAAGIDMVLSGLGGDELFAGYPIFKQVRALQDKRWLLSYPRFARALGGAAYRYLKPGIASAKIASVICEDYFDTEYAYQYSRELVPPKEAVAMMSRYEGGADEVFRMVHEAVGFGKEGYALPLLSRVSYAELSTYLHSVLLRDSDQMSMAHALEVRVPFLDHRLVETVLGIPDKFKVPVTPKKLLTDAMGDLLPPAIVNRTKMGFTFPWAEWLRKDLHDFCAAHIDALASRPQFNGKVVRQRWAQFLKGDLHVTWSRIWYLCALEAWLQRNEVS